VSTSFVVLLRRQVRRATHEVHRRDARLRAIFEASRGVGFVITETRDRVPRIIEFSPGAEKIFGCTREQMLGHPCHTLVATNAQPTPAEQPCLASADFSGEVTLRRHDGHAFAAHLTTNPIGREVTGTEAGCIWIIIDITERKRAEESLTRLATAVEQSGEAILITDAAGTILYANPAFAKTSGYTRAETLGRNPRMLKSGKHEAEFYRQMWETLTRGEVWKGHIINRRKDGTFYEEEATISPVRDSGGKIVNYVAVNRDVTREVQLEAQFRQAQKMEAIGLLAGGVAHDFNNILAALTMGMDLLREKPELDEESQTMLKELAVETKRAANLTRQLLMFSRRSVLDVRVLDLNEVVANLLKMLGRLLGEHLTLVFERRSTLPAVEADAGMLEQVLMNLVVNARDAMPRGGRITLATEAAEFEIQQVATPTSRRPGRFVCLAVSDTGCGMNEATLKRIFEPFFTTKEMGRGTGLGLATAYGIVAQHGGWIEVDSKVDLGTTFRVYLPVAPKAVAKEETPELKPPVVPRGQETLLVVEDDAGVRQMLVHALRLLGYQVISAANGQEAMDLWRKHNPQIDLLLTDMVMPEGMTGLELAKRVRADKPDLKIIVSSGYSIELSELGNATAEGIVYLAKPYEVSRLGSVLRRCLHPEQTPS
jgi:PAS domain S-box-containing protein